MEDLVQMLTKFHRDIFLPDFERIVDGAERRLRDEMHSLFDGLAQQIHDVRRDSPQEHVGTPKACLTD